jgi:hypothetical protein
MSLQLRSFSKHPFRTELGVGEVVDWCDIFNTGRFHEMHPHPRQHYYRLMDDQDQVLAVAHFSEVEKGSFHSPARGTYGGIDVRGHDDRLFGYLLRGIEDHLRGEGARELGLTAAPFAHDPIRSSLQFRAMHQNGWRVSQSELNYSVGVDEVDLVHKMRHNNRKRVRKCLRAGFVFRRCGRRDAQDIYDVISENRAARGFKLSMTFAQVMEMAHAFPQQISLFGVEDDSRIIAGAICVRLNARILYVYSWGHLPEYDVHSPVALLADGIYRFAREDGCELLDIGTVPSVEGRGLMAFKENIGCTASLKLVYTKQL